MTAITDHYSIFRTSKDSEPIVTKKYCERRDFDVKRLWNSKAH